MRARGKGDNGPGIRPVLWMETQHRASVQDRTLSLALRNTLVCCMTQRKALAMEDVLQRNMNGAAARRDRAYLTSRRDPCRWQNGNNCWSTSCQWGQLDMSAIRSSPAGGHAPFVY